MSEIWGTFHCVIDTVSGKATRYDVGHDQGVSLSKDGSTIYYEQYMSEGAAHNGIACPSCGIYAIDRATGKTSRVTSKN